MYAGAAKVPPTDLCIDPRQQSEDLLADRISHQSGMGSLETRGRREHARGVAALRHSQVTEHVGETAPACAGRLRTRESPMRHFTNEGHSAVAETAQAFKGDGAESVTWTIVIPVVLLQFVLVPATGTATRLLGGAMHIAGTSYVHEREGG
jgi:hypothetical protein